MKKKILIGMAVGALLLMVILTIAPNIDSRSMNTNQFNVAGNRLSVKDGVRLTNQQTGVIKDDAGVTRIIQVAGGSSGFNDGFGVNRVQIDAGGVIKLKATNAAQLFQLTGDGYGEASFPWTFDNGILVGGNTNNSVWLFNPKNGLYRNFLFTDSNGDTQMDPDNDLHINSANNFIDGSLDLLGPFHSTNLATFYGGIDSSGTGGSIIEQTASNGVGHVAWKIAHNLPASYTNIFDSTNFTAGWQWFVSSSNANGEIHWTSGPPATISGSGLPTGGVPGSILTYDLLGSAMWASPLEGLYVNDGYYMGATLFAGVVSSSAEPTVVFTDAVPNYLAAGIHRGFTHFTITNFGGGSSSLNYPSSSSMTNIFLGTNTFMEVCLGVESPTDGQITNLAIFIGLGTSSSAPLPTGNNDAVGWWYRGHTNTNWQIASKNGGSTTQSATSFAMDTNSWPVLGFQVDTNVPNVIFFTNRVACVTNTINIPIGHGMRPLISVGTIATNNTAIAVTNHVWLDYTLAVKPKF